MALNIKVMANLARYFGRGLRWVQASGGNISLKIKGGILIKSSGLRLRQVREKAGYVQIAPEDRASDYQSERPSIEVPLHFLTPHKITLHTHPIAVNAIICSALSTYKCKSIFSKKGIPTIIVPYARPGIPLAKKILFCLKKEVRPIAHKAAVLFLRNHGLVVAAESKREILELSQKIYNTAEEFIKGALHKRNLPVEPKVNLRKITTLKGEPQRQIFKINFVSAPELRNLLWSPAKGILFPDMIVFCGPQSSFMRANSLRDIRGFYAQANLRLPKVIITQNKQVFILGACRLEAKFISEVLVTHLYALKLMRWAGLKPRYLKRKQVSAVFNMQEEQYRQKMIKL